MTDISNESRAERAQIALETYVEAKGEAFEKSGSEIVDLIADLLHLAERTEEGEDLIENTLYLAKMHYTAEIIEETQTATRTATPCAYCKGTGIHPLSDDEVQMPCIPCAATGVKKEAAT